MNVESWVIQALITPEDDGDPHIIKVTCRLDAPDVVDLDNLAKRVGMSRTAAATGLLTAAINQAWSLIREYDENPHALDRDAEEMHFRRFQQECEDSLKVQVEEVAH